MKFNVSKPGAAEAKTAAEAAKAEAQASADAAAEKLAADAKSDDPLVRAAANAGLTGLEIHQEGTVVFAAFPIGDSLTKKSIASGAKASTIEILKAVNENVTDYERVWVQGTFPTKDAYGNTSDTQVLNVGFDKATVDKINFDGVDKATVWELRDAGMVHAELGG